MEGATRDADNVFVVQVIDQNGRVMLDFKSCAKTSIGAVTPHVDFASLRDGSAVTLARTNLSHTHVRQHGNLCGSQ